MILTNNNSKLNNFSNKNNSKNNSNKYYFESEYLLYQTEKLIKKSNNLYYTAIEINNKAKHYSNESGIEIFRLKPIVRAIIELAHQV